MRRRTTLLFVLCLAPALPLAAQDTDILGVRAFGFGDVNFLTTELDRSEGFQLGQLVGHVIATMDERVSFFGEVSLTRGDGGYAIELERAIIRYDFSDAFKLSAGRFHTPVGYWNTAYHHGSWLQTSVARPEMIKFGGAFIPTHFVGAMAEGSFSASGLGLGYMAGVGNGRHQNIARGGDAGDVNDHRAWTARLHARPVSLLGFEVGVSVYLDRISVPATPDADERILAAHALWDRGGVELLGELARVTHEPVDGGSPETDADGYYVQVGYRLPISGQSVKPYLRVEGIDPDGSDPIFGPLGLDYQAVLGGVRYDAGTFLALKAEVRGEEIGNQERMTSLYLQASFVISGL